MNAGPVFVASRTIQPGDENGGLYGAIADIIGHTRKVLMVNPDSCYLLQQLRHQRRVNHPRTLIPSSERFREEGQGEGDAKT